METHPTLPRRLLTDPLLLISGAAVLAVAILAVRHRESLEFLPLQASLAIAANLLGAFILRLGYLICRHRHLTHPVFLLAALRFATLPLLLIALATHCLFLQPRLPGIHQQTLLKKLAALGVTTLDYLGGNFSNYFEIPAHQLPSAVPLLAQLNLSHIALAHEGVERYDLSLFANLPTLTTLKISNNQITNLTPLASLSGLNNLGLDSNQITDLTPLASLSNLTLLNLDNNQITDLTPLASLSGLNNLSLDSNQITDTAPLASLSMLTILDLSYNQIAEPTPLASLSNLAVLDLDNNHITDPAPLASLSNLVQLSLDNNHITDPAPLANLSWLSWLHLSGNPIPKDKLDALRKALPECEIVF